MSARSCWATVLAVLTLTSQAMAADPPLYSGPQPGEPTPAFRAKLLAEGQAWKEEDLIARWMGAPSVIVFVHGLERSMAPLMTTLDQYAAENSGKLRAGFVFLTDDQVMAEQRLPLVRRSLNLKSPVALSPEGPEGPGSYALNRKCLLTVLAARDNRVTASFALVQPGIADAPRILAAVGKLIGDEKPPTADALQERRRGVAARPAAADRPTDRPSADLSTVEGLRAAVQQLQQEVRRLSAELAQLRSASPRQPARPATGESLPGAAPTDEKLVGLLRSFIQRTNDPATVDRVLKEVEEYVRTSPDLKKQAIDGWVRVLYLKYGTEYAQSAGQKFVERLRK